MRGNEKDPTDLSTWPVVLDVDDVATLFGLARRSVYDWVRRGDLRPIRTSTARYRFSRREIERLLEGGN